MSASADNTAYFKELMNTTTIIIIGIFLPFAATSLGSALVFALRGEISEKLNCLMLGISSGVMISACIFGLILPCIEQSASYGKLSFLPAVVGIICGGILLELLDIILPHIHKSSRINHRGGLDKSTRLLLSVTLHNIPEGLAVGVALGSCLATGGDAGAIVSAFGLSIGIAIQNVPEGAAVSLPIKTSSGSVSRGFWLGLVSGVVEPIFAVVGLVAAAYLSGIMPWALAFSSGAMLFVTVGDLIPDSKCSSGNLGTWGFIVGFIVMMLLDLCL